MAPRKKAKVKAEEVIMNAPETAVEQPAAPAEEPKKTARTKRSVKTKAVKEEAKAEKAAAKPVKKAEKPAAKLEAKPKAAAAKPSVKCTPKHVFEIEGNQVTAEEIEAKIMAAYKADGHRVGNIKSLEIYYNFAERRAYYVANGVAEDKFVEF